MFTFSVMAQGNDVNIYTAIYLQKLLFKYEI